MRLQFYTNFLSFEQNNFSPWFLWFFIHSLNSFKSHGNMETFKVEFMTTVSDDVIVWDTGVTLKYFEIKTTCTIHSN